MVLEDKLKVLDLGIKKYWPTWELQKEILEKRKKGDVPDTLLLVEHEPVITFGSIEKWNKLKVSAERLGELGIEFFDKTRRGGGVAYLGPGQLIGYTIMEMSRYGGLLKFMKKLEEVMIRTARDFEIYVDRVDTINPTTEKPYRATWYRNNGAINVLCTKGIGFEFMGKEMYTHHGFALNVNKGQSYIELIDPCGFPVEEIQPISMEEIKGRKVDLQEVKGYIIKNFLDVFGKKSVEYGLRI